MTATLSATLAILATLPHGLTPRLGSRAWRDRDRAARVLAGFGPLAIPALEAGARHPCPEVRERCGRLLYPFARELADAESRRILPRRYPRTPWISDGIVGWRDDANYRIMAREAVAEYGAPDWPEYREATRLYVRSLILRKTSRREILDLLDSLAEAERAWIQRHGADYNPPVELPRR